jgi:F0F1-type ATP synthase assembly protein I
MAWAARAMTVSLEMVIPGVIGIWLDRFFGTLVLFTLVGFAGGLSLAIWHLVRIGSVTSGGQDETGDPHKDPGD